MFSRIPIFSQYNFKAIFNFLFKGTVSRDFQLLVFFHESVSPKPLSICIIRAVSNFFEIRGDIRSSGFATGVNDTGGKCKKLSLQDGDFR
jgi:hypothetical protein